jgi:hypothetical protein
LNAGFLALRSSMNKTDYVLTTIAPAARICSIAASLSAIFLLVTASQTRIVL